MRAKNICKYCGGKLLIEYIGSYGSVYAMKADGEPSKNRIRRILYEENDGGEPIVYCGQCGRTQE